MLEAFWMITFCYACSILLPFCNIGSLEELFMSEELWQQQWPSFWLPGVLTVRK